MKSNQPKEHTMILKPKEITMSRITRIIRKRSENAWDVLVDDVLIGRIHRGLEPGLNDRGPRMVIRGYDLDGNTTIPSNDIRHAAMMVFNGWSRRA